MGIGVGLIRFINSIIGGIGSILLFIGVFTIVSSGDITWVAWGMALFTAGEVANLYMVKYEDKKQLDTFRLNFWGSLGATYAFPVLLFGLYLLSYDRFMLLFTMALSAGAVIRTAAMLIKMEYIESREYIV